MRQVILVDRPKDAVPVLEHYGVTNTRMRLVELRKYGVTKFRPRGGDEIAIRLRQDTI